MATAVAWMACATMTGGARAEAANAADATDASATLEVVHRQSRGLLERGRYRDAIAELERAADQAERHGDSTRHAATLSLLGEAMLLAGRATDARPVLDAAIRTGTTAGRSDIVATALNTFGGLEAREGRAAAAAATFARAATAATEAGLPRLALIARLNRVHALADGGDLVQAGRDLDGLTTSVRALGDSSATVHTLLATARLRRTVDPRALDAAHALLVDADAMAERLGDRRGRSLALGYLAEVYARAGRPADASALNSRALFAAQEARATDLVYRWEDQSARLLAASGDRAGAIDAYGRAIDALSGVRRELLTGRIAAHRSFRDEAGPTYLGLADLLLREASAAPTAEAAEPYLHRARAVVERFKGAEIEDYFEDDCVAALRARTAGIDRLGARTAALYPIVLDDRLELLLSTGAGLRQVTVAVDRATLTTTVRELRRHLEKRTTREYLPAAQRLYDWLVRPLAPQLDAAAVDTLVVVPDGALQTVPFAALHDGSQFLVARYAVATTPGLTLTDPQPLDRGRMRVLLNGLSVAVQGFPALPNVDEELERIEAMLSGRRLQNAAFTAGRLADALDEAPYSIVHVGSHGQFAPEARDTFLLTFDDRLDMDTLARLLGTTSRREEPIELLTLSACQTAAGDDRAALGLAGVALKAGARSALATLWFINDRASAALVTEFYRALANPEVSKAQALRAAQTTLLADPRYRHPGYWSPFLLIGNWL
ncbi:MAG: CHAT domain-containing protein [Chromatiales bacterium]|nr:CHAT domain-containing protein [Chromatiales bacterium]